MSEKTEETREILDVSTILTTFLRHGIYRFKFEDVTEAMPFGILSELKRETFGRWLRNPFYQYIPELQAWQFLYGKKITLKFHKFLRPEQKFANLDELKAQIQKDAAETYKLLK